jgi:protein TonB
MRFALLVFMAMAASLASGPLFGAPTPQAGSKTDPPATVRVGGDIKPPLKTKNVFPIYPVFARQARIQGVVIVDATIGTDGKVKDVKVIRSVKNLDDAAIAAVRGCEFKPTVVNGQAVQVIMTIPINFSLD